MTARGHGWLALALAAGLPLGGCRRPPAPGTGTTPPPSAAPSPPGAVRRTAEPLPLVHPQVQDPAPPTQETRPECSTGALLRVSARILEAQTAAIAATELNHKAGSRHPVCGSPALARLEGEVKGALDDRVRICVAQDGPLDAEWNSLSAALSSLGECLDCGHPASASDRKASCLRARDVVNRAQADAQAKSPAPR